MLLSVKSKSENNSLDESVSTVVLSIGWSRWFLVAGACPVHDRMFSSVSGLYPLNVSSQPPHPHSQVVIISVLRCMTLGREGQRQSTPGGEPLFWMHRNWCVVGVCICTDISGIPCEPLVVAASVGWAWSLRWEIDRPRFHFKYFCIVWVSPCVSYFKSQIKSKLHSDSSTTAEGGSWKSIFFYMPFDPKNLTAFFP